MGDRDRALVLHVGLLGFYMLGLCVNWVSVNLVCFCKCALGALTDTSKEGWKDELRTESFHIIESSSHLSVLVARRDKSRKLNLHSIGRFEAEKKSAYTLKRQLMCVCLGKNRSRRRPLQCAYMCVCETRERQAKKKTA